MVSFFFWGIIGKKKEDMSVYGRGSEISVAISAGFPFAIGIDDRPIRRMSTMARLPFNPMCMG
jgi:hypothetical protein